MAKLIDSFVTQVIAQSDYTEMDRIYLTNRVLALVGEGGIEKTTVSSSLIDLKEELLDLAVTNGYCGKLSEEKECLGAELMNFITPPPSVVNQRFWTSYKTSPEQALAEFYDLSKRNDYIKLSAIAKNIAYDVQTDYGKLQITINLSKPEKDPKAIATAKFLKETNYPLDLLVMENEGYQGRFNHPARANHRIIRLPLGDEEWGFQYSPYAYFPEHCIFLNTQHVPMCISRQTFEQLLNLVEAFPGYFVGSNADLPIVGGSILTHNHYQGGRHVFPMEMAELDSQFCLAGYEEITIGIVKWPMSVLRLRGIDKASLVALADHIRQVWATYSDPDLDILAFTDDIPHHTITPIARKKGNLFELDLVLRDNHTSQSYPDGVYHPHQDVQHIKKENIGLIEVMGLAILPPRLKAELAEVEKFLLNQPNDIADYHLPWAEQIKRTHPQISSDKVTTVVQEAVGQVFARVLEDAGVYKRTPQGQEGFRRFVASLGLVETTNVSETE